jgi:hypothetical protein
MLIFKRILCVTFPKKIKFAQKTGVCNMNGSREGEERMRERVREKEKEKERGGDTSKFLDEL